MKTVAYISGPESDIPSECLTEIRSAGINLIAQECIGEEVTAAFAKDAELVWMRGPNRGLTGDVLKKLSKCRAIFRSGSGLDAMPCATAKELGITVLNTPESISESVAEHTVALMLAFARRIPHYDSSVKSGKWEEPNGMNWHITGRTLGLVGYGRIAQSVEKMVSGFSMNVIHYDPFSPDSTNLDELLRKSDFISLHCPLTDETRGLISRERFGIMKPGAVLINTSRGPVLDEEALTDALISGKIGGAALDVLCDEPPAVNNPLLSLDNVIITPHIAAFSADFEKNFWGCSAKKIISFFK